MLGEITGTRWDLYRMTQALRNYLAITHHFYACDCLRIYLNCFYFSVLYFSSQMNCVIDNLKICGVTLVLQILYDSMCNKKLALFCQGCWHIHKLPFWSLSSAQYSKYQHIKSLQSNTINYSCTINLLVETLIAQLASI